MARAASENGDSNTKRELMRAGLRFKTILLAGGLWLAPVSALAQNTTEQATTNTPAADAIGPRELQNFSLPGTKTQPADQAPAATVTKPQEPARSAAAPTPQPTRREATNRPAAQAAPGAPTPTPVAQAPASLGASLPPPTAAPQPELAQTSMPDNSPAAGTLTPERRLSVLPWLIAALGLALASGVFFLFRYRRPREAYASGPEFDLLVPPQLTPAPSPAPRTSQPQTGLVSTALPKLKQRPTSGIVASRLRPSIEIGVQPLRCLVDDNQVAIEFEIELFNAGTAPARAVLAEASLFNPGAAQEQELAAFFSNPVGAGSRIDSIPPMKRITLTSQVVAPRGAIQEFELAGRKTFVPVIAFNALYEWSGGKGQTSASYLVGRETGHDKLGPLHLDDGMQEFRAVGARPLPSALRT